MIRDFPKIFVFLAPLYAPVKLGRLPLDERVPPTEWESDSSPGRGWVALGG